MDVEQWHDVEADILGCDRQGFRNVVVDYDGSHRLNLKLAHERIKPLSKAVGRAGKPALQQACKTVWPGFQGANKGCSPKANPPQPMP